MVSIYTFFLSYYLLKSQTPNEQNQNIAPETNDSQKGEDNSSDSNDDDEEPIGETAR